MLPDYIENGLKEGMVNVHNEHVLYLSLLFKHLIISKERYLHFIPYISLNKQFSCNSYQIPLSMN